MAEKQEKHDEHDDHKKGGGHSGGGGHGGGHGGPGGGGGHAEGEHEGAPEWLISFADNVALLMGFFVIMLAMNMKPAGGDGSGQPGSAKAAQPDMIDLAISVREAFNNPVSMDSINPADLPLIRRILQRKGGQGTQVHDAGPKGDDQDLNSIRPTDYHQLSGAVSFEDDSSELTEETSASLADIADHMRGLRLVIEVRGHASAAEAFDSGDRGMQLSFERARVVATALTGAGLDWRQMRLIASGDNDRMKMLVHDKQGQRRNQRVEIIVTNDTMPETPEDAPDAAPDTTPAPAKTNAGTGGAEHEATPTAKPAVEH